MVSRDTEDPATIGARELDWERFLETQDDCSKAIVVFVAEGHRISAVAKHRGVSSHIVHQKQNQLASNIREFFGENILADVARVPGWKNGLMAVRERHAAVH